MNQGTTCRWHKQAVIYSLDVDTFKDGNGDGVGDFQGLTQSCRYLSGLGVNCVWLLPFYPSPDRDNGYDVTDYYGVDPRLGTLGDFVEFMNEAEDRKLRVLVDLVLNHTSSDHPWFQEARTSRESPYHQYYVWREDEPPDTSDQAIFPPEQRGIWTYEEKVNAWYLHRFYAHQPDLNIRNPVVRDEMKKVMAFWVRLGVAGFRVDAVPFLVEMRSRGGEGGQSQFHYEFLREFRDFLSWRKGDAIMLAEANVSRDDQLRYFGDGDRMHMVLNFLVNQRLFHSLAVGSGEPLAQSLRQMPQIPEQSQWGMFLRNHDELSLDKLNPDERAACFRQFAPDGNMRIFERGVRRRLAPILGGDRRKILLAYSLLFSLPGSPVLWYGEEIGMGENLSLPGRFSVRTPMQWSSEEHGGFSDAAAEQLVRPVTRDGPYGYERVNVERQTRETGSLLNAVQQMIRVRQCHSAFGCNSFELLRTNAGHEILAYRSQWEGQTLIAAHNFSPRPRSIRLELPKIGHGIAADVLGGEEPHIDNGTCQLELGPFGYRWMRVRGT